MLPSYINFGTYTPEDTEILKKELEKHGIVVKVLYPGTSIGRESTGNARGFAFTLTVSEGDYHRALEIRDQFSITPVKEIPLPKMIYSGFNRYFILGAILLWLGLWMAQLLFQLNVEIWILVFPFLAIILFWFINMSRVFYRFFRKKQV